MQREFSVCSVLSHPSGRIVARSRGAALGLLAGLALSACGGGSTESALPQTPVKGPPTTASVVIAIAIPAAPTGAAALRRKPQYVSASTQSAAITVNGGTPVVTNLTAGSPNCPTPAAGAPLTCTVKASAPVGTDTFGETLYAGLNGTGAILSQGKTSAPIVAGVVNTVKLTLGGVIASITLALSPTSNPPLGTPTTLDLIATLKDAGGQAIIGSDPFVTPVTLTNSDASGATTLSKTTLNTPSDAATIAYTGAPLAKALIGASSGRIAASPVAITPLAAQSVAFNDYTTFGYDNGRSVYNPNSTTITPTTEPNLHLAWQAEVNQVGGGDFNTWTQPILATGIAGHAGVLFMGGGTGNVYAYDALTGALLWTRPTGVENFTCEGGNNITFGVGGTAAYDPATKSLYIVGNTNTGTNAAATDSLFHLDAATGAVLGQADFTPINSAWPSLDFSHTSVTLGTNGLAYVGTGATCDISSWRGRVAAINVPAMTLANTFFTVWDPLNTRGLGAQPWGGGGVWGWGGVSLDAANNVFTGVGNTDDGTTANGQIVAPFAPSPKEDSGFGDAFTQLAPDLSAIITSNHPIPAAQFSGASADLDLNGTPVLFQPNGAGCDPMAALQGKSGTLYLYDRTRIGPTQGPVASYQLAPSTYSDGFLGGPAYSPATGLLYDAVSSSNESLYPPGMIAINPGCGITTPSVAWHSAFGPDSYSPGSVTDPGVPRSVPAVSAGGVVFVGTSCAPSGSSCAATAADALKRGTQAGVRKPLICCAPPGSGGGAVWALDASTGAVLNNGNPLIITGATLRMPPTIDGNWIFVLDNAGDLYALTLDPNVAAATTKLRKPESRMLTKWEGQPRPKPQSP